MSFNNAWEVTDSDIKIVCFRHGLSPSLLKDACNCVDCDEVAEAVLSRTDFDEQVAVALCNIEDQLIGAGFLQVPKKFSDLSLDVFEVVVENIGCVYHGTDEVQARLDFESYVGRGDVVTLFRGGEVVFEHGQTSD